MPCEECHRISIICLLKISAWTGQNDFKALLVDAFFFKSKTEKKNHLFQKYPVHMDRIPNTRCLILFYRPSEGEYRYPTDTTYNDLYLSRRAIQDS